MSEAKDKKIWIITNVIIYVFYLYIAICIPYTHDDWDWGLSVGLEQLKNANLNSRYAGNFFAVVLTRSEWIKTLVMSIVFWGIPFLISNINKKNYKDKNISFILCNFFVALIPIEMWSQTYGWVSGFANYILALICVCIYMYICVEHTLEIKKTHICFFVFSVISQLFLENISIYFLIISCLLLMVYIKKQIYIKKYAFILAGNIVGIIIMFSSNIYEELFSEGATLTHLAVKREFVFDKNDDLISVVCSVLDNLVTSRLVNIWQPVKWLVFIVLILLCIIAIKTKDSLGKRFKLIISSQIIIALVYMTLLYNLTIVNENRSTDIAFGIFYVVFYIMVSLYIIVLLEDASKYRTLLCWLSSVLVVLPFSVILEEGSRLYLVSYMLVVMTVIELVSCMRKYVKDTSIKTGILILGLAMILLFIYRGYVYTDIYRTTREIERRIEVVKTEGETELSLPRYRYSEYLWGAYPAEETRVHYFKEFYHIPEEVEIIYE